MKGRVVVITGGARGIGGAAAKLLASRGARIVIADVLEAEAQVTKDEIIKAGGEVEFVPTDVTVPSACEHLVQTAVERFGGINVLLCCHGVLRGAMQQAEELPLEVFDSVLAINLKGQLNCVRSALPVLRQANRPVIILLASEAGIEVPSSSLAYGASKGGVHGFTMTLAAQLKPAGIRVHDVIPSSVATPMKIQNVADRARATGESVEKAMAAANLVQPEDVAEVLAFMASEEATALRGSVFTC